MTIFFISLFSTFLGSICGGGAGLISVPLFFEMGFSSIVVLAITKTNSTIWTIAAIRNFFKVHKQEIKPLLGIVLCTLPFAYFGTLLAQSFSNQEFKKIVGGIVIFASLILVFKQKLMRVGSQSRVGRKIFSLILMPFAFYEGFFGSGNNIIASLTISYFKGVEIKEAYALYYFFAFFWCAIAAVIYLSQMQSDYHVLLPTIFGSYIGGHYGSIIALKMPNKYFVFLVVFFGLFSGARLLWN